MATKKISELQELETLSNNDLVAVVDTANESTKKMTAKKLGAATGIPTNAIIGIVDNTIPDGYEEADVIERGNLTANAGSFDLYTPLCKKIGKIVNVDFSIANNSGFSNGSWLKIVTIPDGYRPPMGLITFAIGTKTAWGTPTAIPVQILSNGEVQVYIEITGILRISMNVSYIM